MLLTSFRKVQNLQLGVHQPNPPWHEHLLLCHSHMPIPDRFNPNHMVFNCAFVNQSEEAFGYS